MLFTSLRSDIEIQWEYCQLPYCRNSNQVLGCLPVGYNQKAMTPTTTTTTTTTPTPLPDPPLPPLSHPNPHPPPHHPHVDGLMQERRNSSALAMELRLSWINPSILYFDLLRLYHQSLLDPCDLSTHIPQWKYNNACGFPV